jgi:hypothetical protein
MAPRALQQKNLDTPDETRTFENGKAQVVTLGNFSALSAPIHQPPRRGVLRSSANGVLRSSCIPFSKKVTQFFRDPHS